VLGFTTIDRDFQLKYGLNSNQIIFFSYFISCEDWANTVSRSGIQYYWMSWSKVVADNPNLSKSKRGLYKLLKSLVDLNLLDYERGNKTFYVRISDGLSDEWMLNHEKKKPKSKEFKSNSPVISEETPVDFLQKDHLLDPKEVNGNHLLDPKEVNGDHLLDPKEVKLLDLKEVNGSYLTQNRSSHCPKMGQVLDPKKVNALIKYSIKNKDKSTSTSKGTAILQAVDTAILQAVKTIEIKSTSDSDFFLQALRQAKSKPPPDPLDAANKYSSKNIFTANDKTSNMNKKHNVPSDPDSIIKAALKSHFKKDVNIAESIALDLDLPTALEKFKSYFMVDKGFTPNRWGGGPQLIVDCWIEFVSEKKGSRKNEIADIEALLNEKKIFIYHDFAIINAVKAGVTLKMIQSIIDTFMDRCSDKSTAYLFDDYWVSKMEKA